MRRARLETIVVVCIASMALTTAGPSSAEVFSDLYLGASITGDSAYGINGVTIPPSILCLSECGSAFSPSGGIRIGWTIEGVKVDTQYWTNHFTLGLGIHY